MKHFHALEAIICYFFSQAPIIDVFHNLKSFSKRSLGVMNNIAIYHLLKYPMPKTKAIKCILCGNETVQGTICALCKLGIPQIRQELIDLLKEDNNLKLLKKLNLKKGNQRISLN
jgi:hypothetical protein